VTLRFALAIQRDATTWHHHVHVRMMGESRAPSVEHGSDVPDIE